jgi:heme-degrading monooxygenase HmoA
MYGTIARVKLLPGKKDEFLAQGGVYKDLNIPGFVATATYRADASGDEYWLAVVFESKESYRANAEDPPRTSAPRRCGRSWQGSLSGMTARSSQGMRRAKGGKKC